MGGGAARQAGDVGAPLVSRLSPARRAALRLLVAAAERDAYVRELIDRTPAVAALSSRDRSFCRRLVLGVTASEGVLDAALDRYLDRPSKVSLRVRTALRLSAFELLYLDTAPEAAVSQGVELVRSQARGAAGLANAVLRRVASGAKTFLAASDVAEGERAMVAPARCAGLPLWLVRGVAEERGTEALRALAAGQLEPAPLALHALVGAEEQMGGAPGPVPGCRVDIDVTALIGDGAFERARAVVTDAHAQLIATAAVRPGTCLEIGAGRGTKTFVMACQARRAGFARRVVALDLYEHKAAQNRSRLERAGLGCITTVVGDGRDLDCALGPLDEGGRRLFDTVFVDAPCSGTGTMRRHPEIPWRLDPASVAADGALPGLQLALLIEAARRVERGGELWYATCSVLKSENDEVVARFLASPEGAGFCLESPSRAAIFDEPLFSSAARHLAAYENGDGLMQAVPVLGGFDGHFCARLVRRAAT